MFCKVEVSFWKCDGERESGGERETEWMKLGFGVLIGK